MPVPVLVAVGVMLFNVFGMAVAAMYYSGDSEENDVSNEKMWEEGKAHCTNPLNVIDPEIWVKSQKAKED